MKKTYKEKYFELKKEYDCLEHILACKQTDILNERERYISLRHEFNNFIADLKIKEERAEKQSFIVFIILLSIISVFGILCVILGSLGL